MPTRRDKSRIADLARRQFGRVSRVQLRELGIANGTVSGWLADGYLHRVLPHVYAVGHQARTVEADLAAALLYAGPKAALSHSTAAWWLGLIDEQPKQIDVTTLRKCRSQPGIRVHDRRSRTRILHRGLAVTDVPEALIDMASTSPLRKIRRALANAEYKNLLDIPAVEAAISRSRAHNTRLRAALAAHQPDLARTKSRLEVMLVEICEAEGIPHPEINAKKDGWELDAYWPGKLVVELDGYGNHHTPGQLRRDRRKEMAVRAMGLPMIRYSEDQLKYHREAVAKELRQATASG